ncbi:HEAT repeat domain-containing protein [Amycolatopsis sp. NPDC059657]|uniref:HEAT repeat domain-containing protein n=1 Tax=Amycolatopsis sp. NPDC059657 TaxID=3346899 RepID=UPI00366F8DE6
MDGIDMAYDDSSGMGWYGGDGVREQITDMISHDPSPWVRREAILCVGNERTTPGSVLLGAARDDPDRAVRHSALLAYLRTGQGRDASGEPNIRPDVQALLRKEAGPPHRRLFERLSQRNADLVARCVSAGMTEYLSLLKKLLSRVVHWDWGGLRLAIVDFYNEHPQDWVREALDGIVENWDHLDGRDRRWTKRFLKRLAKAESEYANYSSAARACLKKLESR